MIKAKEILKDKFWIVENNGEKIGTLSKEDEGFMLSGNGNIRVYNSSEELDSEFGANFLTAKITQSEDVKENSVHGFPTRSTPYNSMFDIQRKLPLFTKSTNSKSVYCAGYYLVKFNVTWLKSFCPKLITIERNQYQGPFRTELEMRAALSNVNRAT